MRLHRTPRIALAAAFALGAIACGPSPRAGGDVDAGPGSADGGGGPPAGAAAVYAHSSDTLYSVDPVSLDVTAVGPFGWAGLTDQMTDIAIDGDGRMLGVTGAGAVVEIDPTTAAVTRLSAGLPSPFNGLSFVPPSQLGQAGGPDVLVASRNADGAIFRVDPVTGAVSQVGNMGGFQSSGDLVSVDGFGTVATVVGAGDDRLVNLAPGSFAGAVVGTDIGYDDLWGVAFWGGTIYGFAQGGQFIAIDPVTGVGTLIASSSVSWWGAAVTTRAPVID
ncbi:MAG: hypothetical protein R2939_07860 [Kofleriaceae bacterium]